MSDSIDPVAIVTICPLRAAEISWQLADLYAQSQSYTEEDWALHLEVVTEASPAVGEMLQQLDRGGRLQFEILQESDLWLPVNHDLRSAAWINTHN